MSGNKKVAILGSTGKVGGWVLEMACACFCFVFFLELYIIPDAKAKPTGITHIQEFIHVYHYKTIR